MPIYLAPISSHFLTRSHSGEPTSSFTIQNLLKNPEKEICSFNNTDITSLRASSAFPDRAVIRPFDRTLRSHVASKEWICFSAYRFSLGLRYPFPEFIMQFFHITGLSFSQTMPMDWRVLIVLNKIKVFHFPALYIEDIPIAYRLRSHGNSCFLLFSTSNNPLILNATKNEDDATYFKELAPPSAEPEQRIKAIYQLPESEKTFSLSFASSSQKSSSDMSAPAKIPEVFDLEELDSYSSPVQVKKEPSPKAATSSKPTSSKATAIPKPSPVTKTRASSARKGRKQTLLLPPTPFLMRIMDSLKGLEHLMHLYEEACGVNKMLEAKLKKAEVTISDHGMIVAAKSQHYGEKFKVMTQEHQASYEEVHPRGSGKARRCPRPA
ncbi:hypothetical protein Hanom_Chr09g00807591 [Helianthus anomalus]